MGMLGILNHDETAAAIAAGKQAAIMYFNGAEDHQVAAFVRSRCRINRKMTAHKNTARSTYRGVWYRLDKTQRGKSVATLHSDGTITYTPK